MNIIDRIERAEAILHGLVNQFRQTVDWMDDRSESGETYDAIMASRPQSKNLSEPTNVWPATEYPGPTQPPSLKDSGRE